jgi:hypothetical protein
VTRLHTRRHHAGIETTDGIAAVLSEDRVKGLVRLVGRVEGYVNPRDAIALPTSLPRSGWTPVLGEHPLRKLVFSYDHPATNAMATSARSARNAPSRTNPTAGGLLVGPCSDLRAEPELDATLAKVEHRPRHVAVSLLILEHRVPVGKAENLGDTLSVDQVICVNANHQIDSLHR